MLLLECIVWVCTYVSAIVLYAEAFVVFSVNLRQWVASLLSAVGLILAHIKSLLCSPLTASCYLFVCLSLLNKHCVDLCIEGQQELVNGKSPQHNKLWAQ